MSTDSREKSRSLTLEIDGPKITADKFRKSINTFLDVINAVVKDFSGNSRDVNWIVSVSPGSALIHFKAESTSPHLPTDKVPQLLGTIQNGFQVIEKSSTRPPHFSDYALNKAKALASIVDGGVEHIKVRWHEEVSTVTPHTKANVNSLFETAYRDRGSLEGRLSEVSDRGERHVYVYDRLLDKHIRCHVTEETLEEMGPCWGKWVNVTGFIRYYSGGEVKDIEVEEFEVFPDPHTLPSFDDVYGLFKDAD